MEGIEFSRIIAGKGHSPVVYFIRIGDRVKIGTTTNLAQRVSGLSLSMLDVAKVVPGGKDVEAALHVRWAAYRVDDNREWFFVRGSLTAFLRGAHADRTKLNQRKRHRKGPAVPLPPQDDDAVTLGMASSDRGVGIVNLTYDALRTGLMRSRRSGEAPTPVRRVGSADLYLPADLKRWEANRPQTRGTAVAAPPTPPEGRNEVDGVDRMEDTTGV